MFAYEDGGRSYLPRVRDDADRRDELPKAIWQAKRGVIDTGIIGGVEACFADGGDNILQTAGFL